MTEQELFLDLGTTEYEEEISIGTILMEQVEFSTKIIVELFPTNQTKESFESMEFSKIYDILEIITSPFFILTQFPVPEGTTKEELYEISNAVRKGMDCMAESILNIHDFKNVRIRDNRLEKDVPVYPFLASLRTDYLLGEIGSFIKYRATEPINMEDIDKLSDDIGALQNIFRLIDTINETNEVRTKHVKGYLEVRRSF